LMVRVVRPAGDGEPVGAPRRRHLATLLASGVGVAMPLAAMAVVNAAQTGHPLLFGYIAMWGPSHRLGFHAAPWGPAHTVTRGLAFVSAYLLGLQTNLFYTPLPALLFATGALLMAGRTAGFDRWVLWSGAVLLAGYLSYWYYGFYLGPRFLLPLAPWLVLWTARLPRLLHRRGASSVVVRAVTAGGVVALGVGAAWLIPTRVSEYRGWLPEMRVDIDSMVVRAGGHGGVVLVRESWGAQLASRMWALDVPRPAAMHYLRSVDACRLDETLREAEQQHAAGETIARLDAYVDSAPLISPRGFPDTAIRLLPGSTLAPRCVRRIREDEAGFTTYAAVLLSGNDSTIYLRDLHAADSVVMRQYPDRPLWLLTAGVGATAGLHLVRLDPDSLWREWRSQ
jgi:hypothetical protein